MNLIHILITIAMGLGATFVMDLWCVFLNRAFKISSPNYCFVGRWLRYMPQGIFRHKRIAAAPPKPRECAIGWIAHYAIGVIFALSLVLLTSARWLQEPTLLPAMITGLITVAFPLFVMQPSFGLGIASSKAPNPAQARLRSLMNHAVFGLGLYISALIIGFVLKA
jgi:Protein of unknown function (DUF2938)